MLRTMSNKQISVVVPLYNEEESLCELTAWIDRVMKANHFDYEVIMIDDGSDDSSWEVVEKLSSENPAIRGIRFSRNYGKSAALYCGFDAAEGDVVITMDADLQDSPDEIPELYRMVTEEGYDIVSGWKKHRFDNKLTKNLPSKLYNWTARKITGIKLHDMNCGLKAYRNEVVKDIEVYGVKNIASLAAHLNGLSFIPRAKPAEFDIPEKFGRPDFADVKGTPS